MNHRESDFKSQKCRYTVCTECFVQRTLLFIIWEERRGEEWGIYGQCGIVCDCLLWVYHYTVWRKWCLILYCHLSWLFRRKVAYLGGIYRTFDRARLDGEQRCASWSVGQDVVHAVWFTLYLSCGRILRFLQFSFFLRTLFGDILIRTTRRKITRVMCFACLTQWKCWCSWLCWTDVRRWIKKRFFALLFRLKKWIFSYSCSTKKLSITSTEKKE